MFGFKKREQKQKLRGIPNITDLLLGHFGFRLAGSSYIFKHLGTQYVYKRSQDIISLGFDRFGKAVDINWNISRKQYDIEIKIDDKTRLEVDLDIYGRVEESKLTTEVDQLNQKQASRNMENEEDVRVRVIQLIESLYSAYDYLSEESQRVNLLAKNTLDAREAELDCFLEKISLQRVREADQDQIGEFLVSEHLEEREAAKEKLK